MSRVNEHTPLLVNPDADTPPPFPRRRLLWKLVLAGALSLSFSFCYLQHSDNLKTAVSFVVKADDTPDAAFEANIESFKDPAIDPCVDFYEYACGGWIKSHTIPPGRSSIDSSFSVVADATSDTLQRIFDTGPPQIGPFVDSCLNVSDVDPTALAVVKEWVQKVHQAPSARALMDLAGRMKQSFDISTFFSLAVLPDPTDPTVNILHVSQGGFSMPSRDYYLDPTQTATYRTLYREYVTKMFAIGDLDHPDVDVFADNVLKTETVLANASVSIADINNPLTTNKAFSYAEIAQRYPFLMAYVNGIYAQEAFPMDHAIIKAPTFFDAQTHLLNDASKLSEVKNYLIFRFIDSVSSLLGEHFRRASHEFHAAFRGTSGLLPRDQFCSEATMTYLQDEIGQYYLKQVLSPEAKASAEALVKEIEDAMSTLLRTEAWLDEPTYDAAVQKLQMVRNFIGGPDHVPPLPFQLQEDAFFDNARQILHYRAATMIQSIGKPVDRQAWDIATFTVDAYYDRNENKMVFPAAILQSPFYNAEHFPAAANFARIGMVMGHELTHGFDNEGRNFDGTGALHSWWTPSVATEFAAKAQCLVDQYSTFPIVSSDDGHVIGTVDGNLTLSENIADNGGIRLAYEAYQLWKKNTLTTPPSPSQTSPERKLAPDDPNAPNPAAKSTDEEDPAKVPAPAAPQNPAPIDAKPVTETPSPPPPASPTIPIPAQPATPNPPKVPPPAAIPNPPTVPTPPAVPAKPLPPAVPAKPTPPAVPAQATPPAVPSPPAKPTPPQVASQPKPKLVSPDEPSKPKDKAESDHDGKRKEGNEEEDHHHVHVREEHNRHHEENVDEEEHYHHRHEEYNRREEKQHKNDHNDDEKEEDDHHHGKKHHKRKDEDEDADSHHKHAKKHWKEHEKHWKEHEKHWKKHDKHHHECGKDNDECGRKHHTQSLAEKQYPFSGGDVRTRLLIENLARALAQPDKNDAVADDDRLFFTAFAHNFCQKHTPQLADVLRKTDMHSPGKWRVNGPLMNYDKFAEVFSCPVGTPMNPPKKCRVW